MKESQIFTQDAIQTKGSSAVDELLKLTDKTPDTSLKICSSFTFLRKYLTPSDWWKPHWINLPGRPHLAMHEIKYVVLLLLSFSCHVTSWSSIIPMLDRLYMNDNWHTSRLVHLPSCSVLVKSRDQVRSGHLKTMRLPTPKPPTRAPATSVCLIYCCRRRLRFHLIRFCLCTRSSSCATSTTTATTTVRRSLLWSEARFPPLT